MKTDKELEEFADTTCNIANLIIHTIKHHPNQLDLRDALNSMLSDKKEVDYYSHIIDGKLLESGHEIYSGLYIGSSSKLHSVVAEKMGWHLTSAKFNGVITLLKDLSTILQIGSGKGKAFILINDKLISRLDLISIYSKYCSKKFPEEQEVFSIKFDEPTKLMLEKNSRLEENLKTVKAELNDLKDKIQYSNIFTWP